MNVLIVDIGNTRIKCAVMSETALIGEVQMEHFDASRIEELVRCHGVESAIVSSTRSEEFSCEVELALGRFLPRVMRFEATTPTPLRSDYLSPQTLGRDRLAAAVGAESCYPGRAMLVVDFGTAITCDWISEGCYHGGFISPGMRTRFRALHDYTARLPEVEPTAEQEPWGRTTQSCIAQGVMQGITYEIEGHIARFRQENQELLVIFAGGDAKHFEKRIKNAIFADCDLVYCGLNRILRYNMAF